MEKGTDDFVEELGDVLSRLYALMRRSLLSQGSLSLTQALVLSTLRDRGPQRITDLAEIEGVRQPTCTAMVNTLESAGWAVRRSDESDGRAVVVEITARGKAVLRSLTQSRNALLADLLAKLAPYERQALSRALAPLQNLAAGDSQGEAGITPLAGVR